MSSAALATPDELLDQLGSVTVLDVRWKLGGPPGEQEFLRGHVPGASYVDLEADLSDPPGERGRHPMPEVQRFEDAMRRCGVRNDRPVVVYDDNFGNAATRAWWLLRYHGHREVRVLDGGYAWWVRSGGPVEEGPVTADAGDFSAEPGHLPLVDAEGAARLARDGVLLDARAPERFRGEVEPIDPVAGHIPGAVNLPSAGNLVGPDRGSPGRFLPADDLAGGYARVGVRADVEVGVYCGSGVTATHDIFALALLGRTAALYPGSWSEWVADPDRPVATGD